MNLPIALAAVAFLPVLAAAQASQPAVWQKLPQGELMLRPFKNAPYPHPSRAKGYTNQGKTFGPEHYSDSTIGIFIPADYKPANTVNYVVHFHGWSNHVSQLIPEYKLPEQMQASKVNAILIVPQGPKDAQDSGGGKLELDPGAFKRLIEEITAYLNAQHRIHTTKIGKIVLTTHSGGYKVTAAILHLGGLTDHITDVILLDSSYGSLEWFADWAKADPHRRLVSMYTDHLAATNKEFMQMLDKMGVKHQQLDEATMTDAQLAKRGVTFFHTKGPHNNVPVQYFGRMLKTSELGKE